MKFQRHALQLLPDRQRRSYAGAAVMVLHGLGRPAGRPYNMRDTSLPPRRRLQVQDRCETASSLPLVMPASLQTPKASVNLGKRPLIH